MGVPYVALGLCTCFSGLAFLNVSAGSSKGGVPLLSRLVVPDAHDVVRSIRVVREPRVDIRSDHLDVHLLYTHVGFATGMRYGVR